MRLVKFVTIVSVACITQSCKVEMLPLMTLLSDYERYYVESPSAYHFGTSSRVIQYLGFKDTLLIGDTIEFWEHPWSHARDMHRIMTAVGIPGDQVFVREELRRYSYRGLPFIATLDFWKEFHQATRVVHLPLLIPLVGSEDASRIEEGNIVFVGGTGNVDSRVEYYQEDRDLYNRNHVVWSDNPEDGFTKDHYQNILDIYNTGKAIVATSAFVTPQKTIEPFEWVVSCGDIKKACFTIVPSQPTSPASARLASMTFYLAQLCPRAEDIVEILGKCAVDVGEKGIDREYGRGVANLLCPPVLKKELEVVSWFLGKEEKKEEKESTEVLTGEWTAEQLEVYLPSVLQETLQLQYEGEAQGTAVFEEEQVKLDFSLSASVTSTFLLVKPIEAKAEERVQGEGVYTTEGNSLVVQTPEPLQYTYVVTEDSLKLIRSFTLHEALRLLPGALGAFAEKETEDWFEDDPIQIITTFARVPLLVGDFDRNNIVDFADFLLFTATFGTSATDRDFNKSMDLIPDGMITFADFLVFVENFGKSV